MKSQYYVNNKWSDIDSLNENNFFSDLDGYNGSEKTVFFRFINESGDTQKNNVLLRIVEKYNSIEYPLAKFDNLVKASGGNPKIDSKISYSVLRNADPLNTTLGVISVPDENGVFKIGDLPVDNGSLIFAVTLKIDSRIIIDFGESLKVSDIFFRFSASTN